MISRYRTGSGFTLLEIMLTLALIGILVGIALPAYNGYKLKGNRTQAINALTEGAIMQERWYTENGTYTGTETDIDMPATTPNGRYTLSAVAPTSETFTLTATAASGQQADENCQVFTIDQAGRKRSKDDAGDPSTGCWD